MASILGRTGKPNGAPPGAPFPPGLTDGYFGLLAVTLNLKQSRVPVPCRLLSSITSRDQTAFVAFLAPRPLTKLRLSCGAKNPTKGAFRPGVAIEVRVWLSKVVSPPEQPAKPFP